jgi:hypothetical protein
MQAALAAGADVVVTMDGDDQHRVDDVPRLLRALAAHPRTRRDRRARALPRPDAEDAALRQPLRDFWVSWAAGHRVLDSQSGQRAYPAALLREARPAPRSVARVHAGERAGDRSRRATATCTVAVPIDAVYVTRDARATSARGATPRGSW